ncbi:MAG: D-alanyl-D-alanine carboxypeptidase family protein [Demequina sp.]
MDAIASITHRIGLIHHRIATVSTPSVPVAVQVTPAHASVAQAPHSTQGFADLLAAASGSESVYASAGRLNSDGVPVDLAGYGNGHVPESALAPIQGSGERMWGPAAESLNRLLRAAQSQGVSIGVTDGYRDFAGQVRVAQEKGLYSQGGLAAVPGTSQHGWGMAVDLRLDATAQAWMREHAGAYGFVEAVPREPWHWEFHPGR